MTQEELQSKHVIEDEKTKEIETNNKSKKKQSGRWFFCCICNIFKKACCKCKKDTTPSVSVLRLSGVIGEVGGFKKGLSLNDIEEEIKRAFDKKVHKNLKAVAVQVNSPGGSPVQSELIYQKIRSLSEEKNLPVYTFAEDVAASGGYWLMCSGDELYASSSSIVGSIGVISSGFGFVDTIKKLGIERRVYTQGENKSVLDPFQEEDQNSIEILKSSQKDVHDAFKYLVNSRRGSKIDLEKNSDLFSGKFWSGKTAKELGLIDEINNLEPVIKEKFGNNVKIIKVQKSKGWLKKKLSVASDAFVSSIISKAVTQKMWSRFGL